jgi:tetratricopeptide (TPR) repeat protein
MKTEKLESQKLIESLLQVNRFRLQGNYEGAISICKNLINEYGIKHYFASVIAGCYFGLASYDEAMTWFSKALELMPDDPSLHTDLAGCSWIGCLDYDRAASEYRKALSINPKFVTALKGLAVIYGHPESPVTIDEAIECLEQLCYLMPDHSENYAKLGELYLEKGKAIEAEKEWIAALTASYPLELENIDFILDQIG